MHKKTKYDRPEKQDKAVSGSNSRYTRGSSAAASAGKTTGKQDKKQGKKQAGKRVRKPLTDEQRKRKNEKDRIRRMLKRMDAKAAKTMSDEDRRRLEAMDRRELEEHYRNMCLKCSPECRNYAKCKGYARTEGLPKLHKSSADPSCAHNAPVNPPQSELRGVDGSVFDKIAEWVRGKIDTVRNTAGCNGILSDASFNCHDGVFKVKFSLGWESADNGDSLPCSVKDHLRTMRNCRPQKAAWRSEVSPALVTPPPVLGPGWLCGIDWGHPGGPEAYGDLCAIERIVRSSGWDESYCS